MAVMGPVSDHLRQSGIKVYNKTPVDDTASYWIINHYGSPRYPYMHRDNHSFKRRNLRSIFNPIHWPDNRGRIPPSIMMTYTPLLLKYSSLLPPRNWPHNEAPLIACCYYNTHKHPYVNICNYSYN